jgi:hypothetical protein
VAPSAAGTGGTLGLGLYLRARPEAGEEADDAAFDALDAVLEVAREELPGCGLAVIVEGADFLLAAAPVPAGAEASRAWRQRSGRNRWRGRESCWRRCCTYPRRWWKSGAGGAPRVVDGPLLRQSEWTASTGRASLFATRVVLENLAPLPRVSPPWK